MSAPLAHHLARLLGERPDLRYLLGPGSRTWKLLEAELGRDTLHSLAPEADALLAADALKRTCSQLLQATAALSPSVSSTQDEAEGAYAQLEAEDALRDTLADLLEHHPFIHDMKGERATVAEIGLARIYVYNDDGRALLRALVEVAQTILPVVARGEA